MAVYEDTADRRQLLTTGQALLMDSPAHYQIHLLSQVLSASAQRPAQGRARARVCASEKLNMRRQFAFCVPCGASVWPACM